MNVYHVPVPALYTAAEHLEDLSALELSSCISTPVRDSAFRLMLQK